MRTTIDLPESLFREVKIRAVEQGRTLKDLLANYIEAGLRGPSPPDASDRQPRPPLPVAIQRTAATPLTRALTNRELNAILEEEDLGTASHVPQRSPGEV